MKKKMTKEEELAREKEFEELAARKPKFAVNTEREGAMVHYTISGVAGIQEYYRIGHYATKAEAEAAAEEMSIAHHRVLRRPAIDTDTNIKF